MQKVLCLISGEMADVEVTLALQVIKAIGRREVATVAQDANYLQTYAGSAAEQDRFYREIVKE
jgi:hypothetical protein